jgi:flagellar biosynthetic protein FliP
MILLTAGVANAAGTNPLPGLPASTSSPLQIALLLTALALLPALLASVTPFLRIIIVLHFLRQALGTQTTPSNQLLLGLSLMLALLIIQPMIGDIYEHSFIPYQNGQVSFESATQTASRPFKDFLLRFAKEKDLRLMYELTKSPLPTNKTEVSLSVLVPAYMLSELRVGFQIGAVLFLPFLVIDLVVASVTLSVGMVQLPPVMLSAPLKILLFVLVDGWNLVIGSLVKSFY